jgi:hypothetical protein
MATRVLHGIKFFEQCLKVTTKGTFLWSLDEIGLADYEEMSFKVKVNRLTDGRRTNCDHKSSICHIVTGKLKQQIKIKNIFLPTCLQLGYVPIRSQ